MQTLEQLKFPIGKFVMPEQVTEKNIIFWAEAIRKAPYNLRKAIDGLKEEQLDATYRPDGWTIRQVIHHLADSHSQSFARFKLALTEDSPTIKPYLEGKWALTVDSFMPIRFSVEIISGVHARWHYLIISLTEEDRKRTFFHPEQQEHISLEKAIALYAWHCHHHIAHITEWRKRNNL